MKKMDKVIKQVQIYQEYCDNIDNYGRYYLNDFYDIIEHQLRKSFKIESNAESDYQGCDMNTYDNFEYNPYEI